MSEDSGQKTPREELTGVVSRLKEMAHHSKTNIEHIGTDWFLLDDTLKLKDEAKRMEKLLDLENQFKDLADTMIEDFEIKCNQMAQEEGA